MIDDWQVGGGRWWAIVGTWWWQMVVSGGGWWQAVVGSVDAQLTRLCKNETSFQGSRDPREQESRAWVVVQRGVGCRESLEYSAMLALATRVPLAH